MRIRIRLFASLRERAAAEWLEVELIEGATVQQALYELDRSGPLAGLIGSLCVQMAVNRDYATPQTVLDAGDELALIPPVSGGEDPHVGGEPHGGGEPQAQGQARARAGRARSGRARAATGLTRPSRRPAHVAISAKPLELEALLEKVRDDAAGAIVVFEGVTRELPRLEYEAYSEMAQPLIHAIVMDCLQRHGAKAAAVEHRIGTVPLGEPSVIVAVSAAHRQQAFDAAREIIDQVKARAPIWKQEMATDGTGVWVHD